MPDGVHVWVVEPRLVAPTHCSISARWPGVKHLPWGSRHRMLRYRFKIAGSGRAPAWAAGGQQATAGEWRTERRSRASARWSTRRGSSGARSRRSSSSRAASRSLSPSWARPDPRPSDHSPTRLRRVGGKSSSPGRWWRSAAPTRTRGPTNGFGCSRARAGGSLPGWSSAPPGRWRPRRRRRSSAFRGSSSGPRSRAG